MSTADDSFNFGILPGENQWPGTGLPRMPRPGGNAPRQRQQRGAGRQQQPQLPMPGVLPENLKALFPGMSTEQIVIAAYGSALFGPAMIAALRRRQEMLRQQQADATDSTSASEPDTPTA